MAIGTRLLIGVGAFGPGCSNGCGYGLGVATGTRIMMGVGAGGPMFCNGCGHENEHRHTRNG